MTIRTFEAAPARHNSAHNSAAAQGRPMGDADRWGTLQAARYGMRVC